MLRHTLRPSVTILTLPLLALALGSCAKGSATTPTPTNAALLPPALEAGVGASLASAWDLSIAADSVTLEPIRDAEAIGDHYTINGGYFFTVSPDRQALMIRGFSFNPSGELTVDWALRHPFKSVAQGATRSDLDVFDVRLAFRPLDQTSVMLSGADRAIYPDLLIGADGYTPDLVPVTGDAAALPYVIHRNESDFNRLAQGTDYQPLQSVFAFGPGEQASVRVYLLCQYGASATRQTRLTPTYYNPEYNLKSPWSLTASIISTPLMSGQIGNLELAVEATDWNDSRSGATVDSAFPEPTNLAGIRAASDLTGITLIAPDLNPTPVTVTTPTSGTGAPADPFAFTISIGTPSAPAEGQYLALVKAADSRTPNDNSSPSENGIDAGTTGAIDFFALAEYATYQIVHYTVEPGIVNDPPVAVITSLPTPPEVLEGQPITFFGTDSTDDNGIVTYEWDFDYQAGSPAFVDLGPTPAAQTYPTDGLYTVALRVTDGGAPALSDTETMVVTVNDIPPVTCGQVAVWTNFGGGQGQKGNPNGTGAMNIAGGRYFRISADGSTVVYSAGAGIGGSLYVWRQATGSQLLRPQSDDPLTYGFRADEVDLSGDGSLVVYTNARAGANPDKDVFIQSTTGGPATLLSPNDTGCYEWPRISQQGNKCLVYIRSAGQMATVNPNGTGWTLISPASDGPGSINADGTRCYVERTFRNAWSMNIDGTNPQLIRYVGDYWVVSADESTIAYMDLYDNGRDVWVANVNGTGTPVKVLDADVDGFSGYWVSVSCDGSWVGFGTLLGAGGSWQKSTGQRFMSTASAFPASLYDGVIVGTAAEF